jgi:hypothetical protein
VAVVSNLPDESRYPSVEEFAGWYNLGYDRDDGLPVMQSRDRIPDFEHAEFFDLYVAENQWFGQLVPPSDRNPLDPLAEPPFFLRSSADDRTLDVDVNCDYLTVEHVQCIQREFLSRYPLWRVILSLENPSCAITIYPDAIRYGNFPLGVDANKAIQELVSLATASRETRLRPQRAEVAYLQQQLRLDIREIGNRPFLVLGVLDNHCEDYSRLALYLLIRSADDDKVGVRGPEGAGNDFLWTCGAFGVNADGALMNYDSRDSAAFRIAVWLPPADYRGPLTLIERETDQRHTFELTSRNITRTVPEE